MVVTKMRWAADGGDDDDDLRLPGSGRPSPSLGILAFEAASTMTKLLSLHRSLSEKEVARLRSNAMRAAGVEYLSSTDQAFLLRLACAEAVAALDDAAAAVARIGVQCGLDFAGPYASLKAGAPDARLDQFVAKGLKVKAKKMERLVAATAKLCTEMEALDELEAAEQKLARRGWGRLSGPIPSPSAARDGVGSDSLRLDIRAQRARVRRLKEESLWSQSYEKAVILMARAACAVFVRVCVVFGAHVAGLPPPLPPVDAVHTRLSKLLLHPMSAAAAAAQPKSLSGPIQRRDVPLRIEMSSNSCPIIRSHWQQPWQTSPPGLDWRKLLEPPPGTVGGAGLDLQYANVITTAERLLVETEGEGRRHEEARAELYAMLPSKLRAAVRAKLRGWWKERAGGGGGPVLELDAGLAEGWRSAAGRILAWLAPMAQDTARWHAERSMDRQRRFEVGGGGARTWALQTLRWADAEKAEAAVVEVLVALSCVGWYEERRPVASPRF